MAEELYPGASFAAPFAEASAMAPLSQIPTNILQSLQAARASARADDALALQQETFAFNREATLRKQKLQDVDRELTSQLDNPPVSRSRSGYGSSSYGADMGPAGVASMRLRKGGKGQAALAPQVQAEQAAISGSPTTTEFISEYGAKADKDHRAYQTQQEALEGRDFAAFSPAPEGERKPRARAGGGTSPALSDVAYRDGVGSLNTVDALIQAVGQGRQGQGEVMFYDANDLADLLVAEEASLIAKGYADISDELMTEVVKEVWKTGPRPPEDASKIDKTARQFLESFGGAEAAPTQDEAYRTLESQGFHPEEAASIVSRIEEIAPAYRSEQVLSDLGLVKPGQRALTESDMEKNPATFFGLPPQYSRTPDKLANQIYRTAWGRDVDSKTKAQVLENYRVWYKDRVSERRRGVARSLDKSRDDRISGQENALESSIQSFMDQGRAGAARPEIANDDGKLRRWAWMKTKDDPAHKALTAQFSSEKNAIIGAGPGWAENTRKRRLDNRTIDLETERTQAEYNDRAAKIVTDPANVERLEEYGISFLDSEGNYRPAKEINADLERAHRSRQTGSRDDDDALLVIKESFGTAETEARARRPQKRKDPDSEDSDRATRSQGQRQLDHEEGIHDTAYRIAISKTKVPKTLIDALNTAVEESKNASSRRVRQQAREQATVIRAELSEFSTSARDIVHGDDSLLSTAQRDSIMRGRALVSNGGGGGGDVDLGITSGSGTSTDPVQDKMTRLGFVWNATKRVFEKTREDGKVQSVDYARASRVDE